MKKQADFISYLLLTLQIYCIHQTSQSTSLTTQSRSLFAAISEEIINISMLSHCFRHVSLYDMSPKAEQIFFSI